MRRRPFPQNVLKKFPVNDPNGDPNNDPNEDPENGLSTDHENDARSVPSIAGGRTEEGGKGEDAMHAYSDCSVLVPAFKWVDHLLSPFLLFLLTCWWWW